MGPRRLRVVPASLTSHEESKISHPIQNLIDLIVAIFQDWLDCNISGLDYIMYKGMGLEFSQE